MKQPRTVMISLEDVTEELVIEYLCAHPEFFQRHEDILETLYLTHPCGDAVSLIERQVELLRKKYQHMQHEMIETIRIAKDNEQLYLATQRVLMHLISAHTVEEMCETLSTHMKKEFGVDFFRVGLVKFQDKAEGQDPYIFKMSKREDKVILDLLNGNKSVCKPLAKPQRQYLFGVDAKNVASMAIIPLGPQGARGLIALGSRNPKQFHRELDTLFLDTIGKIVFQLISKSF